MKSFSERKSDIARLEKMGLDPFNGCPTCQGKGEVRTHKRYVGCFTVACADCKGTGYSKKIS